MGIGTNLLQRHFDLIAGNDETATKIALDLQFDPLQRTVDIA